ncbi:hypothetical protein GH733_003969 [Mirounga leonina]|nr:hypothetical protein GH733_003969 [Mirounga leonina]
MVVDQANGIKVLWPDESNLNRYLLDHMPTKVLEDLWDPQLLGCSHHEETEIQGLSLEDPWALQLLGWPWVMKKLRFVAVPKNHQDTRNE